MNRMPKHNHGKPIDEENGPRIPPQSQRRTDMNEHSSNLSSLLSSIS